MRDINAMLGIDTANFLKSSGTWTFRFLRNDLNEN